MPKFQKKPVQVEAYLMKDHSMWEDEDVVLPEWLQGAIDDNIVFTGLNCEGQSVTKIATNEGVMTADIGDWIIQGVKGELYPCKPDIFEMTYDEVAS